MSSMSSTPFFDIYGQKALAKSSPTTHDTADPSPCPFPISTCPPKGFSALAFQAVFQRSGMFNPKARMLMTIIILQSASFNKNGLNSINFIKKASGHCKLLLLPHCLLLPSRKASHPAW